jgi:hypothetical protein
VRERQRAGVRAVTAADRASARGALGARSVSHGHGATRTKVRRGLEKVGGRMIAAHRGTPSKLAK